MQVPDTDLSDASWNIEGKIGWMGLSRADLWVDTRLAGAGCESVAWIGSSVEMMQVDCKENNHHG